MAATNVGRRWAAGKGRKLAESEKSMVKGDTSVGVHGSPVRVREGRPWSNANSTLSGTPELREGGTRQRRLLPEGKEKEHGAEANQTLGYVGDYKAGAGRRYKTRKLHLRTPRADDGGANLPPDQDHQGQERVLYNRAETGSPRCDN